MLESAKCKYYHEGKCYLHVHPDCKQSCGEPSRDCIHICEMEYPCIDMLKINEEGEVK